MQEQQFKKIYNEHSRRLYNFIMWITHNRAACDDILQNVFIKIWKVSEVPSEPDELQRWLLTVARNACLDFFRKTSRFSSFRTQYTQEYYKAETDPDSHFIWKELSSLSEVERSILFLHIKSGYSYKEIGAILGKGESLIRVKAFRALKKLRETLVKKEL